MSNDKMKLPEIFRDVDMTRMWDYLGISDELTTLNDNQPMRQMYWTGMYDAFVTILGDLLQESVRHKSELVKDFYEFRQENQIEALRCSADD
jgi:hypothetical protein